MSGDSPKNVTEGKDRAHDRSRRIDGADRPLIPLAEPNLGEREAELAAACVRSGWVSSAGPFVERFERGAGLACGLTEPEADTNQHAGAVGSGTAALHLAMRAVGVKQDELVIMPSYTFAATANAASFAGAEPWFIDIDAESWCLDPAVLREQLARETERVAGQIIHRASGRRVAAVAPVFTLGIAPDMESIGRVAAAYGLPVVADAACAIGTRAHDRPLVDLADAACLSFNGNKTMTCGGGGLILARDASIIGRARHLSTQARTGAGYEHDERGFNFRMTSVQAAIGCAQLERLDELLCAKRQVRDRYTSALAGRFGLQGFPEPAWSEGSCWLSGVVLDAGLSAERAALELRRRGVGARSFWKPLHLQSPYAGSPRSAMPVCEQLWDRVLTLPCSTGLSAVDQRRVIELVPTVLASLGSAEPQVA